MIQKNLKKVPGIGICLNHVGDAAFDQGILRISCTYYIVCARYPQNPLIKSKTCSALHFHYEKNLHKNKLHLTFYLFTNKRVIGL